jgi:WD40 repeat protein
VLENHFSIIRGLDFSFDGETLVSGSRDQVVNFWDLKSFKLKTTLPVYEVSSMTIAAANISLLKQWDIFRIQQVAVINISSRVVIVALFEYGIPKLVER